MSTVTYYDILCLPMTASMDEIRDAYQRRLRETETGGPEGDARQNVPRKGDLVDGKEGERAERTSAPAAHSNWLGNAYKVLSNGDLRRLYDEHIRRRGCVPDPAAQKMASLNDKPHVSVTQPSNDGHELRGEEGTRDGAVYPPGAAAGGPVTRPSAEDRLREKQFRRVLHEQNAGQAASQEKSSRPSDEDVTQLKSTHPSPSWQLAEQGKPPRQEAMHEKRHEATDNRGRSEGESVSHVDPKTNARYEYARSADGSVEAIGYSYDSDQDPSYKARLKEKSHAWPRRVKVLEEQLYGGRNLLAMYPSHQSERGEE